VHRGDGSGASVVRTHQQLSDTLSEASRRQLETWLIDDRSATSGRRSSPRSITPNRPRRWMCATRSMKRDWRSDRGDVLTATPVAAVKTPRGRFQAVANGGGRGRRGRRNPPGS
jgi:hypothetical protein